MTDKRRRALTDRLWELLDALKEALSPRQPEPVPVPVPKRDPYRNLRR